MIKRILFYVLTFVTASLLLYSEFQFINENLFFITSLAIILIVLKKNNQFFILTLYIVAIAEKLFVLGKLNSIFLTLLIISALVHTTKIALNKDEFLIDLIYQTPIIIITLIIGVSPK